MANFNKNKFNCLGDAMLEVNSYLDMDKYIEIKDTPMETIAQWLCGSCGYDIAIDFMTGETKAIQPFLDDIKYCSTEVSEMISLAITKHCKSIDK